MLLILLLGTVGALIILSHHPCAHWHRDMYRSRKKKKKNIRPIGYYPAVNQSQAPSLQMPTLPKRLHVLCKSLQVTRYRLLDDDIMMCLKNAAAVGNSRAQATLDALQDFDVGYSDVLINQRPAKDLYATVLAPDGCLYKLLSPVDEDMLQYLMDADRRMRMLIREVRTKYPTHPVSLRLDGLMRKRGYLSNIVHKHDLDVPTAGAYSKFSAYFGEEGTWLAMSKGWTRGNNGDMKVNFGSVIHELAHMSCPYSDCNPHGAGWCRAQAFLSDVAAKMGLWDTPNTAWKSRIPDMMRASYTVAPGGDGIPQCDTGNLFA